MSQGLLPQNYKGYFATESALVASIPNGQKGYWVIVEDVNGIFVWNASSNDWVNVGESGIAGVMSYNGRVGTVTSENGDYTASQITFIPSGGISATDVKDAINELDTEKANIDNTLSTGNSPVTQNYAANISGAYSLDWRNGAKQRLTLTGNVSLSIVPASTFGINASTKSTRFTVTFVQGSGGGKFITTNAGIKSYVTGDDFWVNQQLNSLVVGEEVTIELWGDGTNGWCAKQLTAIAFYDEVPSASTIALSTGVYTPTVALDLGPGRWRLSAIGHFVSGGGTVTGTIAEVFISSSSGNNATGQNLCKNTFRTAGMPTTNGSSNAIGAHYEDITFASGGTTRFLKFRGVFTVNTIRVAGGFTAELII